MVLLSKKKDKRENTVNMKYKNIVRQHIKSNTIGVKTIYLHL